MSHETVCRESDLPIMMEFYASAGPGHTTRVSEYIAAIYTGTCRSNNFVGDGEHVTDWYVSIKVSSCDNI